MSKRTRKTHAGLTAREEAACQHFVAGKNRIDAYLAAGFKHRGAKVTLYNKASAFFQRLDIQHRIRELRAEIAKMVVIDRAWVIEGMRRNAEDAHTDGQYQASTRALELIGREMFRMFTERREIGRPGDFSQLSSDEIRKRIADTLREAGVDPEALGALLELADSEIAGSC